MKRVIRPDYLRRLGGDVDAALALIVHDLVATGAMVPDEAAAAVRIRAEFRLRNPQEPGLDVSAYEAAIWVAEVVQEDIIEGHGVVPRLVTWPACPQHPTHPLWLRSNEAGSSSGPDNPPDDPAWTCITRNQAIAELGAL